MSSRLRDTHSYETQIIDAVRSVNRALGGTYGTSSAIYKSEFNQYEVQLIDAIKGIGRTLSGSGLSGVGGGASSEELQALSRRVTKLEQESFFRLVDGNVTLKEGYSNLWVPGWLAAGGVGTSGGGGGVSCLRQLEDVYHDSTGILRGNGDPVEDGDVIVYDTTDPDNPIWIAAAMSAAGAVTNYGDINTGRIAKIGSVNIYNDVAWGSAGQTANTYTLTVNGVTKTVALEGYGGGGGGGAYTLGTATAAAAAKGTMLGVNAISNDLSSTGSESSLIVWDSTNSAWHFLGNIYSDGWIAAGGTGTPGSGGSGIDLAAMWASLTNSVADAYASTKINIAHIPSLTVSMITDWANVYTLRTPVSTTAANGVLLGVDALSNASSSVSGSDSSRIEWDSTNSAWRVRGNLYADGWVAAGGIGSGGGGANSLSGLSDVNDNLSPAAKNVLWYDSTNSIWDAHALTYSDISDLPTANETGFLKYYLGTHSWVLSDAVTTVEWDTEGITTTGWTTIGYLKVYDSGTHSYTVKAPSGGGGSYTLPIASSSTLGGIKVGSGLSINPTTGVLSATGTTASVSYDDLTTSAANVVLGRLYVGTDYYTIYTYPSGGSGGSTVSVTALTSTGTKIATITVDNVATDLYAPTSGGGSGSTVNWGTGSTQYAPLTVDNVTKNVLIGTNYVTLDTTQTITGAKTFTTNEVTIGSTSGLSVHQSSYIDIGNARLVYDSSANALHVTKKPGASGTMGFYADGFVAAGGTA